jgi:hypothetical protein
MERTLHIFITYSEIKVTAIHDKYRCPSSNGIKIKYRISETKADIKFWASSFSVITRPVHETLLLAMKLMSLKSQRNGRNGFK